MDRLRRAGPAMNAPTSVRDRAIDDDRGSGPRRPPRSPSRWSRGRSSPRTRRGRRAAPARRSSPRRPSRGRCRSPGGSPGSRAGRRRRARSGRPSRPGSGRGACASRVPPRRPPRRRLRRSGAGRPAGPASCERHADVSSPRPSSGATRPTARRISWPVAVVPSERRTTWAPAGPRPPPPRQAPRRAARRRRRGQPRCQRLAVPRVILRVEAVAGDDRGRHAVAGVDLGQLDAARARPQDERGCAAARARWSPRDSTRWPRRRAPGWPGPPRASRPPRRGSGRAARARRPRRGAPGPRRGRPRAPPRGRPRRRPSVSRATCPASLG